VAIALSTADIRTHTVALQQAAEAHRAQAHQLQAHAADDARARAYIDAQLRPWIRAAKQQETQLRAALDAHAAANAAWREAAGRLLAEARAAGDQDAGLRVSGLDAAYRRGAALPVAP
jgi:small-conductance mechanosensitive channel